MNSLLAYCFAASTVVLMFNIISPVEGQCTVHGCETDDSSNNIVAQMREVNSQLDTIMTRLEAVDRRSLGQDASLQQLKNQQDTVLARLQEVDRRSQAQVQHIHEFLNASFQEIKNEQDSSKRRLEAVARRSEEQDIYMKQIQSVHEFFNESFQHLKSQHENAATRLEAFDRQETDVYMKQVLNASLQQMKDKVMTRLQEADRRSQEQVQHIHEFLNVSFQEIKNEQDSAKTKLEAADRRSHEQYQSIREFLNASFPQLKDDQYTCRVQTSLQEKLERFCEVLNASFQQMKHDRESPQKHLQEPLQRLYEIFNASFQRIENRHDNVVTNLETVVQTIKNQTRISLRLATAIGIGDWKVIMNRFDGSVIFFRNWVDYRYGFGDKERGEFWLGNEQVHRLTNRFVYTLRVEVQLNSSGEWYYAEYSSFSLDSENNKYRLRLSGYSGNAGDALTNSTNLSTLLYNGGMSFSTWDNDNDRESSYNCAQTYSSGWWFNYCFRACLTCSYETSFYWNANSGWQTSGLLRAARMMIRSA